MNPAKQRVPRGSEVRWEGVRATRTKRSSKQGRNDGVWRVKATHLKPAAAPYVLRLVPPKPPTGGAIPAPPWAK